MSLISCLLAIKHKGPVAGDCYRGPDTGEIILGLAWEMKQRDCYWGIGTGKSILGAGVLELVGGRDLELMSSREAKILA